MKNRPAMWSVMVLSLLAPIATYAQTGQSQGVNSYTPDEERRAREAVTEAEYTPAALAFAQAGDFFFNATRGGQTYSLTVTPEGKVYASMPAG